MADPDKLAIDRLVWIDLEMTGLNPDVDQILEAALLITNGALEVIATGPELVLHQPDAVLAKMDKWNQEHHGASGLIDRVRASTVTAVAAEQALLSFVQQHGPVGTLPLAGNSIHQDRAFIRRHWPKLETYLHYRMIDVSTIKELVRRWYPDIFKKRPDKRGTHRAIDDIHESLAELRYYRENAFINRVSP